MITKSHEKFECFIKNYWAYYKEIEEEIINTRRYVDFDEDNFTSFSVEYLKLYQAICSEIDVIGKAIAGEIDSSFKADDKQNNIYKWWLIIQNGIKFPIRDFENYDFSFIEIAEAEVEFFNNIQIKPWNNFKTEKRANKNGIIKTELVKGKQVPEWWSDYNKVKHSRTSKIDKSNRINYTKANLGNVVKSISALYILELSYMHAIGTKNDIEAFADVSKLFERESNITSEDIDKMFDKNIKENVIDRNLLPDGKMPEIS